MELDQYLYDEFIAEANEHLLTIEDDFMALEEMKDAPDPDLVDKVFRAVHSVKGGSAFLGLTRINELAHAMENLLSQIRENEKRPESEYIDALLQGVDLLSGMIADVASSNETDISDIHVRLKAMVAGEPLAGGPAEQAGSCAPEVPEGAAESEVSPEAPESSLDLDGEEISALLEEFDFVYLLKYDLLEPGLAAPADIISELSSAGEVKDARLVLQDGDLSAGMPGGPLELDVLYATLVGDEYIEMIAGLPGERIHRLGELGGNGAAPEQEDIEEESRQEDEPPQGEDVAEMEAAAVPEPPAVKSPAPAAETEGCAAPKPGRNRSGGTVRINVDILDKLMTLAGELVLVRNQQLMTRDRPESMSRDIIQRLDLVTTEIQQTVMRTRMQPIDNALCKLPRIVRDLSVKLGKKIDLEMQGNEVELDKTIIESLNDPLTHIIRNCCDHGIETPEEREAAGKRETGRVMVRAYHEGGQINIEFEDDGKGIDPEKIKNKILEKGLMPEAELEKLTDKELCSLIMLPGFSTAGKVSEISGRGVGMDVVKHGIEELGGSVELDSRPGKGTLLHLRLPLTLAIIPCLIAKVGGHRFAIPQVNLEELVCLYDKDVYSRIESAANQEVYRLRDRLLPLVRLNEVLERRAPFDRGVKAAICEKYRSMREKSLHAHETVSPEEGCDFTQVDDEFQGSLNFAVVKVGAERFGLIVDEVLGTEEIVVKPMHSSLKPLKIYSGATVMGDGGVALILDIEGIARHARVFMDRTVDELAEKAVARVEDRKETQYILIFRHGGMERFALALPLIRRIEKISMSDVERVGEKEFITVDDRSTLILRLDRHLSVEPGEDVEDMYLILPKFARRPFGILMSEIVDIEEASIGLNTESHVEEGLLGTDLIRGRMTLFPDIYRLIEKAEPEWFKTGEQDEGAANGSGSGRKVLLAEDSPFLLHMIKTYLESEGFDVMSACNGKQGLELLAGGGANLIVSDLEMPIMDGFEFIKAVRRDPGLEGIPAMALTSLNTEEDKRRALNAGFDDFQVKIDRERFLNQALRLSAKKEESASAI